MHLEEKHIEYQLNGLKDELNTLGVTKPIFIFLHSKLKNKSILKKRLKDIYVEDTGIYYLPHYSQRGYKIGSEENFCKSVQRVIDEIENKYNK